MVADMIHRCDEYLASRTGKYSWRRVRYEAAAVAMFKHSFGDDDTLVDVGAGWTELDYCLRAEHFWRGRYIPIDGGIDGVDLEHWKPYRDAEWYVALEVLEHLYSWMPILRNMQECATKGVVLSTPNPETTDVLGMDDTHVSIIRRPVLEAMGFMVEERSFYGQERDSLFAYWYR